MTKDIVRLQNVVLVISSLACPQPPLRRRGPYGRDDTWGEKAKKPQIGEAVVDLSRGLIF